MKNGKWIEYIFSFSFFVYSFFEAFFDLPSPICAQIPDATQQASTSTVDSSAVYVIGKIVVEGNKTTKSYIILRELPFNRGDTVTVKDIDYARDRIYSTSLFTKVLIQPEPVVNNKINLLIYVEERWYIWPYPVLGFRDRDLKKFYAGAGVVDLNFTGRSDRLAAMFGLGYDPFGAASYIDPAIGDRREYILSTGVSYSHGRNIGTQSGYSSGEFDDTFGDFYVYVGKRLGIYSVVSLQPSYNYVARNTSDSTSAVLSPTDRDIFASLKFEYSFDSRDLKSYAMRGTYFDLSFEKNGLGESQIDFVRSFFDVREYLSLSDWLALVGRFHGDLAEGPQIPPYNHVFFGYYERIRGMFNTISEGESMLGGNVELRIPIIRQLYFEIPDIPFRQFISNRIALYWSFFGDFGETSNKYLALNLKSTLYGYGGGLTLLLPYDVILQSDYARGSDRHSEFIFDFGEAI